MPFSHLFDSLAIFQNQKRNLLTYLSLYHNKQITSMPHCIALHYFMCPNSLCQSRFSQREMRSGGGRCPATPSLTAAAVLLEEVAAAVVSLFAPGVHSPETTVLNLYHTTGRWPTLKWAWSISSSESGEILQRADSDLLYMGVVCGAVPGHQVPSSGLSSDY